MKKLFFTQLFLLSLTLSYSQKTLPARLPIGNSYCSTPATSTNFYLNKKLQSVATRTDATLYCLKVYFHVIRRSNGTGGQSVNSVQEAFSILQQDFNPHNIFFGWDNTIDYINNDTYYSNPTVSIYSINNHQDGIDIYLFDDTSAAGGRANGVGQSSEFWVSGSFWEKPNTPLVRSHVISHELGHVFFLWHTHHGTFDEGNTDLDACPELVNGSNSSNCGDYVTDTPADPHLQFDVNSSNCNWNSSGQDSNGEQYQPDEENIMAYTHVDCMSYFTNEQGERMRNAISSLDFLTSVNLAPLSGNLSITSTGSYILTDRTWTRLVANYDGRNSDNYQWEWIIPGCYARAGSQKKYVDVSVIPRMSMGSSTTISYINIQIRAMGNCGNFSEWFSKIFEVRASSGIIPDCPNPPCDDVIYEH